VVYGLIFVFSIKGFQILGLKLKEWVKTSTTIWKGLDTGEKLKRAAYWTFLLVLLASFLILYLGNTLQTPLEHHDALIYGNLGKMYYHQKQVTYSRVMRPTHNGFYFQGSQKPAFSLLLTWEMMLNNKQTNQSPDFDLYFRSMSGYYGILFIGMYFFWLYRKNKYLALLGLLVLFSGLRFFLMMVNYHLDAYRMFFLVVSWIWLAYALKRKDGFSLFLFGVFSGFTAFTHLIGLIVAVFNVLTLFIFNEDGLKARILKVAAAVLLIAALGNIHYLMDALFGPEAGFITYISD
jgi:4-amino-4-deoxy-L-arabinose transferase-like glycosyltransferase